MLRNLLIGVTLLLAGCAHNDKVLEMTPDEYDRNAVRLVIQKNMKLYQRCYDEARKRDPKAAGKIQVAWNLDPEGMVHNAAVMNSTSNDKTFDDCVATTTAKLVFAPPRAETQPVEISYPFVFSSDTASESSPAK